MKKLTGILATTALLGLAPVASLKADANYFGYSYGTDTLPQGKFEAYQWITGRFGKAEGNYQVYDLETEIEYGFSPTWQGSLYFTSKYANIDGTDDDREKFAVNGIKFSVKNQLKSVAKDGYGLAWYVEPGIGTVGTDGQHRDEYELEFKLLFEKHLIENELIYVSNLIFEPEWEREPGEATESELKLNWTHGLTYRVAPGLFLGGEADLRNASGGWNVGDSDHSHTALFMGPCAHYQAENGFWATLTVLPQVAATPSPNGGRDLDEFTKLEVRLKVGYYF